MVIEDASKNNRKVKTSVMGKLFGKASEVKKTSKVVSNLLLDDEKIIKIFKFIVDEIVLTNYGVYIYNGKLISKKFNIKFVSNYMISGIEYFKGGSFNFSSHIKILSRNSHQNIHIKISKGQDNISEELIKLIKIEYLSNK